MAWNPGKIKEGEFPQIAANVRTANPHAMGSNQRLSGLRHRRLIDINSSKDFGFGNLNSTHFLLIGEESSVL
jgi:hypothetical protein